MVTLDDEIPPDPDQVDRIRNLIVEKKDQSDNKIFHQRDLDRFLNSKEYVTRFWIHAFQMPGGRKCQEENTVNLASHTFSWRKEFGAWDISEDNLDNKQMERGSLFSHGRDRDGCKLLVFAVRKHVKDSDSMKNKKFLIYMLDRLEREDGGMKITILFDCKAAGLKNIEIEAIQFLIHVLLRCYPDFISKIIVFDMPWILNSAWKLVKSLLPPPAVERIQFVTKDNIDQFIDSSNLLESWGGTDPWEYHWVPEKQEIQHMSTNGNHDSGTKAVQNKPLCWNLEPSEILKFHMTDRKMFESQATIRNTSSKFYLAYKFRSRSPSLFIVSPHTGLLAPDEEMIVRLQTVGVEDVTRRIEREQFQVSLRSNIKKLDSQQSLNKLFDSKSELTNCILRCEIEGGVQRKISSESVDGAITNLQVKTRNLKNTISDMERRMDSLYNCIGIQFIILLLIGWFAFVNPNYLGRSENINIEL